jgi:hypothetical protein
VRFLINNGATRQITKIFIRDGSTTRQIKKAFIRDGSTTRLFFSAEAGLPAIQNFAGTNISSQVVGLNLYGYPGSGTYGSYTYAWQYSFDGLTGWTNETGTGATGSGSGTGTRHTYTTNLTDDQVYIRFKVVYNGVTKYSSSVYIKKRVPALDSANYPSDPVLSGNTRVGATLSLSSHWIATNTITNDQLPDSYDIYWTDNTGTTHNTWTQGGTVNNTYIIPSGAINGTVSVYMTATNSGGTSTSTTTRTTSTITAAAPDDPLIYYSQGSASSQGYFRVVTNNSTSTTINIYRTGTGTGTSGYGNGTWSLWDYQTISDSSTGDSHYYDIPLSGYYYLQAYSYNSSSGLYSNTKYFNKNVNGGTTTYSDSQTAWLWSGPANTPTTSSVTASTTASQITLRWNEYYDSFNSGYTWTNNDYYYDIYYNSTGTTPSSGTAATTQISNDHTGSYVDNPPYSTTRYYWIRGVTSNNNAFATKSSYVYLGSATTIANPNVAPTITGSSISPTSGTAGSTTFTAYAGTITGTPTPTTTYQWQYFSSSSYSYVNVSGATSQSYSPPSNFNTTYPNYGFYCLITVTNSAGSATDRPSATLNSPVSAPSGGSVTLSGSTTPGSVITASTSGWSGSPTSYDVYITTVTSGTPTSSSSRVSSSGGTSSTTYTITSSDAVSPVNIFRAFATATNSGGTSGTVQSANTITATASGGGGGGGGGGSAPPAPTISGNNSLAIGGTFSWSSSGATGYVFSVYGPSGLEYSTSGASVSTTSFRPGYDGTWQGAGTYTIYVFATNSYGSSAAASLNTFMN